MDANLQYETLHFASQLPTNREQEEFRRLLNDLATALAAERRLQCVLLTACNIANFMQELGSNNTGVLLAWRIRVL